jgi:hypothetical protein
MNVTKFFQYGEIPIGAKAISPSIPNTRDEPIETRKGKKPEMVNFGASPNAYQANNTIALQRERT